MCVLGRVCRLVGKCCREIVEVLLKGFQLDGEKWFC